MEITFNTASKKHCSPLLVSHRGRRERFCAGFVLELCTGPCCGMTRIMEISRLAGYVIECNRDESKGESKRERKRHSESRGESTLSSSHLFFVEWCKVRKGSGRFWLPLTLCCWGNTDFKSSCTLRSQVKVFPLVSEMILTLLLRNN